MKKIILVGILGAVITFAWSAFVHMNPLTGMLGLSMLNEKEDAVMASVREQVPQPGLYFFPGMDMSKAITPEQKAAWTAKHKEGPTGLLLVQPKSDDPMPPRMLIIEFVSTLGCALIAAFILTSTVGPFTRRVGIVMLLGLFSWLAISVSQWDWYAFPFAFVALDAIDQIIGWLLAGLVMAALIKPPKLGSPANA